MKNSIFQKKRHRSGLSINHLYIYFTNYYKCNLYNSILKQKYIKNKKAKINILY